MRLKQRTLGYIEEVFLRNLSPGDVFIIAGRLVQKQWADATTGEKVFNVRVKRDAMQAALTQGYATATDLADYLVKKGLPFRDAHETVAHAVRQCVDAGCDLADLSLEQLQAFSPLVGEDVFAVLTLEGSVAARDHVGGTAPNQVRAAVARLRTQLASQAPEQAAT